VNGERGRTTIETATWAAITSHPYDGDGYPCGCHPSRKEPHLRFHLCDYHEGYDEGYALLTADLANERAEVERLTEQNATLRRNEWRLIWGLCIECGANRDKEARCER
jgi:hypothetical protein